MADSGGERQTLGQFAKCQTKYGTANISIRKASNFIKHFVSPGDSLVGIALKYGVSVEQLKRENKLWSNDEFCIREYLRIPLTKENSQCIPENSETVRVNSVVKNTNNSRTELTHNSSEPAKTPDVTAKDFLSRYDCNIAQLKYNVQKMGENSSLQDLNLDDPLYLVSSRTSLDPLSITYSFKDRSSPVLVIRSRTKNQRVKSTLQKSEQADEDLYQL